MANIQSSGTIAAPDPVGSLATVLVPTSWCVVREQRDEYLVYNSRTDELHLISPMGRYLYMLCDGLRTVAEIQALVQPAAGAAVSEFLAKLAARGLVEPVRPPDAWPGAE